MKVLNLKFLFPLYLFLLIFHTESPAFAQTTITVNAATAVNTIPNELFGQNYSVYDSTAKSSDPGYAAYTGAVAAMGAVNIRYPGGGYADLVNWNNITCQNAAFPTIAQSIAFATASGARLQPIVNYSGYWCNGQNTHAQAVSLAAAWVTYMNKGASPAMPTTYWEVGNETFGSGEKGFTTDDNAGGTTYGNNFADFWTAMKAADPAIKIGAQCQFDHQAWSQGALAAIKAKGITPDFLIAHAYPYWNATQSNYDLAATDTQILGQNVNMAVTFTNQMNALVTGAGYALGIPYWMTEFRSSVDEEKAVEWVDTMWSSQFLLELGRLGWKGANIWSIKNGYSATFQSDYGLLRNGNTCANCDDSPANNPRPTYYLYPFLSRVFGRNLVSATSSAVSIRSWASKDAAGNLTIFMVNNNQAAPVTATVNISGFTPAAAGSVWTMIPAGTTKANGTTPAVQERWISVNGAQNPTAASLPGAGNAITTSASFPVTLPSMALVLVKIPSGGAAGPTNTPTRTPTPTPTQCSVVLNGCNTAGENGTWSGVNANRTFITSGYPAGSLTEGTGVMQVAVTTGVAYNGDMFILTGFTPALFTGAVQLKVDINAPATFITAAGGYHTMALIADSGTTYFQQISSTTPNLVAGQQTLTFNLDYPASITSAMSLSDIRFVLNAQTAALGTLYVDNIRLVNACGVPTNTPTATPTATPCVVLFNGCEGLTQNGNWTGVNATRSLVTAASVPAPPAGAVVQGTGALKVQVTTPNTYNTDLFNLDSFSPGNWYGVTRLQANIYVDASLLAGTTYNQLLLYADSFPATTFQPISSTGPSLVAGTNTLVWNIDYKVPGTGVASGITAGMPLTKLIFIFNNGPVSTNLGNIYVDNVQMLRDGCLPTPTNTRTFTSTSTPTITLTPTLAATNTFTRTNTATQTTTPTPSATPTWTRTFTNTSTNTVTNTLTRTATPSATPTSTPSNTLTNTSTNTVTNTPTNTPLITNTRTNSPTNTMSATPTSTRTNTNSPTSTFSSTFTNTPTKIFTNTVTNTPTNTPLITNTPTNSPTNTMSATPTSTRTNTNSPTSTFSNTSTNTPTKTFTNTATNTPTNTPLITNTPTNSPTNTMSATPTSTRTNTNSPTSTFSNTSTNTPTKTFTNTVTNTPTNTPLITNTPTATVSATLTNTATNTPSRTPTPSATFTSTLTYSPTATMSATPTWTRTSTNTFTNSPTFTLTSTVTITFTGTQPATNTPTHTPTSTFSPTRTFSSTATFTPTFTATKTNTNTSTPSLTLSNTPVFSVTPTATSVTVSISNGTSAPMDSTQLPGTNNVPVLQFQLNNPGSSGVTVTSLTLTASGSGSDKTGIATVSLYADNNNNGIVDGADTLLGTGTYSGNNGTVVFNFTNSVPSNGSKTYLVEDSFTGTANGTFQASIQNITDLTGTNGTGPVNFNGAPLNGATITLSAATSTVTNTMTPTATFTRTNTPTATSSSTQTSTNTPSFTFTTSSTATATITPTASATKTSTAVFTATAKPTGKPTPIIYPNPAPGPVVNILTPPFNGPSNVTVKVFTVAFRLVQERVYLNIPSGTAVPLELTDRQGKSLASGLYYVVVTTSGGQSIGKLLVMR